VERVKLAKGWVLCQRVHDDSMQASDLDAHASDKKGRRCLVPASGYFEWTGPNTDRQPHYFMRADGARGPVVVGVVRTSRGPRDAARVL
jgi:putative SOS response-associated peptidase YedK